MPSIGELIASADLALRTLSTDLYPPDLGGEGLEPALEEMLDQCEQQGLTTVLDVPEDLDLTPTTALVAYRVVREALRNVEKHAGASHVVVGLQRVADCLQVRICDDGRGFDTGAAAPDGHLGLRVLRDTVTDAGGHLQLRSAPGETVLEAALPLI